MTDIHSIFKCTRCGYCCQGETTVSLDPNDQARMIRVLEEPREKVQEKYWRIRGSEVQMKTVNGHCIFYDEGCTVHKGRPHRCVAWPLHASILTDENNLLTIRDSCPGINKDVSYEKVCEILIEFMQNSRIVC